MDNNVQNNQVTNEEVLQLITSLEKEGNGISLNSEGFKDFQKENEGMGVDEYLRQKQISDEQKKMIQDSDLSEDSKNLLVQKLTIEPQKHFDTPKNFTDDEINVIISETALNRPIQSFSKDYLDSRVATPDQIEKVLNRNLSNAHSLTALQAMNVENKTEVIKEHMAKQMGIEYKKPTGALTDIQKGLKNASHTIEKMGRQFRID